MGDDRRTRRKPARKQAKGSSIVVDTVSEVLLASMLVFDTGKTLMLGGAGGGGSEVAMDVDGSWMKLISFFWRNASCGQQSQRCAKSSSAGDRGLFVTNIHRAKSHHGRALECTSAQLCTRVCLGPVFGETTNHF
jgi:hypothetical protein